jgi:ion channel-forming bestrophin family protein
MVLSLHEYLRSGRTLSYVLTLALLAGLYACLPILKEMTSYRGLGDTPPELHAALSLVVGWLLVFRTNTAHARWWEARTLWGALVNASRNLGLKLTRLGTIPAEDLAYSRLLLTEFPIALKMHLRGEASSQQVLQACGLPTDQPHVPLAISTALYQQIGTWRKNGAIDGDELRVIDAELAKLMEICGGCERIQRTRIIGSYRVFARQCVLLFLVTLPWGIVQDFGWWTAPLTALTAYFMLGMEIVAEHVEEPFGYDDDDLDLDSLCRTIDQSLASIFSAPPSSVVN